MELFIFVSGVGTLVLLAAHLFDYALESALRPKSGQHVPTPEKEIPTGDVSVPLDPVVRYDRAA